MGLSFNLYYHTISFLIAFDDRQLFAKTTLLMVMLGDTSRMSTPAPALIDGEKMVLLDSPTITNAFVSRCLSGTV